MEEKNNTDLEKATSRRSRKDEEGRDFQCGCGKRYLSYPALYTHIKTKHEGRQPQGTLKTGLSVNNKRAKGKFDDQSLKSILSYLQKQELRFFDEVGEAISGSVPLSSRIKKDFVPKQLYEEYLIVMKHQVKLQSNSPIDLALVVYLLNLGEHVNEKVYEQFVFFAKIAKNSYAEHGDEVHKASFSKRDTGPFVLSNFAANEVKHFPIMCDFIINSYIPITFEKELKEINISLMELLIFDFCNWLFLKKLTPIATSFAKEFKLDYKPPVLKSRGSGSKHDHFRDNNSKENKEDDDDESQQLSENEDIDDDYIQQGERKQSGSKERF